MPKGTATCCIDCGRVDGIGWWQGRYKHPGSAGARCEPCYLEYCRVTYWARRDQRPPPKYPKKAAVVPRPTSCRLAPCVDCGCPCRPWTQGRMTTLCIPCRASRIRKRRGPAMAARWEAEKAGDRTINWRALGERDGWVCHLCKSAVDQAAGSAHVPRGATVDHLTPIVAGGAHVWENVALAHRVCNSRRQARSVEECRVGFERAA